MSEYYYLQSLKRNGMYTHVEIGLSLFNAGLNVHCIAAINELSLNILFDDSIIIASRGLPRLSTHILTLVNPDIELSFAS